MKKFVLIDANAIIHRAYHAMPKTLRTPEGQLTNAVYGFVSILLGILEYEEPDYIATAFDMKGPTFRDEMMTEYKGTRAKTDDDLISQFPLVQETLAALSIPIFEKPGLEADDYLGIVAYELEENHEDIQTVIVTNDQDAFQLIRKDTIVVTPLSGYSKIKRYGRHEVMEKLGVWPEQVPDYKGLRGDTSDNIPGVPGIGQKGATKLLAEFETLERIYERISEVKPDRIRGLLIEHEDSARLSKKVATILHKDEDLKFDIEACSVHDFNIDIVRVLFDRLRFRTPMRRVEALNKNWSDKRESELQGSLF
jgi:DNA polymerase-1